MISLLLITHHVVLKVFISYFCFSLSLKTNFIDYHGGEWEVNEETEKRERLCTYKVTVTAVFGQTTICSSEKQVRKRFFYLK